MIQLFKIRLLWTFSRRLKSNISDPEKVREALIRYNRENKLQFGDVIKKPKAKPVVKANTHVNSHSNDSIDPKVNIASDISNQSIAILNTLPKKSNPRTTIKNDSKFTERNDELVKKRKSSKPKLDLTKNEPAPVESSNKPKQPRKTKVCTKKSSLTNNDEVSSVKISEGIQIEENEIDGKQDVADNPQIDAENGGQHCNVALPETKENGASSAIIVNLDEENIPNTTPPNPFYEFTLLSKFKKLYSPDQIYTQAKAVSPSYYPYPSVYHILSESMSAASAMNLKKWKENMISELGNEEFQVYSQSLMHSAVSLRKLILLRLHGTPEAKLDIAPELQGCWESLKFIFPLFPKVKDVGKLTVHPELKYKGMVDSLIEFRNKLVLVSWKKANKYIPSLDKTYDMPIQCVANMGAINSDPNFPFLVDEALLVMSYTNGMKADVFHLKIDQCQRYWKLWLDRLNTYHIRATESSNNDYDARNISKSEFEKLNIEEELAKMKELNISSTMSESDMNSSPVQDYVSKKNEYIDSTLVADISFPLFNEEKNIYIDEEKCELGNVDHTLFSSCPAVTTILSETKSAASKFILERWKNNMIAELGVEGFDNYQKNLLSSGASFHKLIQNYLEGNFQEIPSELQGCWDSLQRVFPLISEVKFTESKVVHEKLHYKGIVDCVAKFHDKLVVIDWKKSDKLKTTINMTYDAPLQIAAYIGAINFDSNYPFKVQEGLLVISYFDGSKADVYHLNEENCHKYWEQWLQRLRKYQLEANANCQKINY